MGAVVMAAVTVAQYFLFPVSSRAQPWFTAILVGFVVFGIVQAALVGLRQSAPESLTLDARSLVHVRAGKTKKTTGRATEERQGFWTLRREPRRTTRLPRESVTGAGPARDASSGVEVGRKGDRPFRVGAGLTAAEAEWLAAVIGRWLRSG